MAFLGPISEIEKRGVLVDLFRSEPRNEKARKVQWTFLGPSLEIEKRGRSSGLFRPDLRNRKARSSSGPF